IQNRSLETFKLPNFISAVFFIDKTPFFYIKGVLFITKQKKQVRPGLETNLKRRKKLHHVYTHYYPTFLS
ncbi:hypothetical protein P8917_22020, partial [Bacillus atrophaeus]|uniref:hypothetical protein n=1 Tax=Bacillus atrophaeus TaxID=1452 RepID=UPI002DB90156